MGVYMCVYVCLCVCMCMYCVCVCMCMYVVCMCVNVCLCICVCMYIHIHTHSYTSRNQCLCVNVVTGVSTFACTVSNKVDFGVSTVDIGALTFLIRRVNSLTSTNVEVDVRASTVNIRASTVDQSSVLLLYWYLLVANTASLACFCCAVVKHRMQTCGS